MNLSEDRARKFAAIVGGFYDAATDSLSWAAALERLGGLFEIQGTIFEHHDAESGNLLAFEAAGLPDSALREWAEHYYAICPRVEMIRRQPAGTIGYDYKVLDRTEMNRHPVYQEFLRPYGGGFFLSSTLERDAERITTIAMQRTIRQGHASGEDVDLLRLLTPPLQLAFRLKRRLLLERERRETCEQAFHRLSAGVVIVDSGARIAFMNLCAEEIATVGGELRVRNGRLGFGDRRAHKMLLDALVDLSAPGFRTTARSCLLRRPLDPLPLRIDFLPLPKSARFAGGLCDGRRPARNLLVVLSDPRRRREPPEKLIRTSFRLTPREAQLAIAIGRGTTVQDYAEAEGIALTTARTHLVNLRHKTGSRNQADVIRLFSRLVQPFLD
jgi:DNA-binding CsgD family transcriptional regulator